MLDEQKQMVSHFPRLSEAPAPSTPRPDAPPVEGFGERMLDLIREAFCGLHGHDNMLQFEHDRMFLKCVSCGHESPGWELNDVPPPSTTSAVENRPQPFPRPHVVSVRPIVKREVA